MLVLNSDTGKDNTNNHLGTRDYTRELQKFSYLLIPSLHKLSETPSIEVTFLTLWTEILAMISSGWTFDIFLLCPACQLWFRNHWAGTHVEAEEAISSKWRGRGRRSEGTGDTPV